MRGGDQTKFDFATLANHQSKTEIAPKLRLGAAVYAAKAVVMVLKCTNQ